jgi:hypothetical protein
LKFQYLDIKVGLDYKKSYIFLTLLPVLWYVVDDGVQVLAAEHWGNFADSSIITLQTPSAVSGSVIEVIIRARTSSNCEEIFFDNI